MVCNEEKGACEISQGPRYVLLLTVVLPASMNNMSKKNRRACRVHQTEYPPQGNELVIEALTMAKNMHEEDVGSRKVGSHRRMYGGSRGRTFLEGLDRVCTADVGRSMSKPTSW